MTHADIPYDIDGFKPLGKRMRLFGGGGKRQPTPAAPTPPPQQAKAPSVSLIRTQYATPPGASGRSASGSMLTIADEELNIGKNLLGE